MIKKWMSFVLCFALVGMLSVSVSASTLTDPMQADAGDVFVQYVGEIEGVYSQYVIDGEAEIRTDGKTVVSVSGIKDEGLTLVVIPVAKNEEAYSWFEQQMKDVGTKVSPYAIYLQNAKGERVPFPVGVSVSVTMQEQYMNPVVASLMPDGKKTLLECILKDGRIVFTASDNGYYVFAEKDETKYSPSNSDSSNSSVHPGNQPQTGDTSNIMLWLMVGLFSGMSVVTMAALRKKSKDKCSSRR